MIGAQIKKLAKPIMKKVGMNLKKSASSPSKNQRAMSAVDAHSNIAVQNILNVIFSIITLYNWRA